MNSRFLSTFLSLLWLITGAAAGGDPSPGGDRLNLYDIFGRCLNERGIELVDWDGYIANPAIRIRIWGPQEPPKGTYPIGILLKSSDPALYFNVPSETREQGSEKRLAINDPKAPVDFEISVWPSRTFGNRQYQLSIFVKNSLGENSSQRVPVSVIDEESFKPETQITHRLQSSYPFLKSQRVHSDTIEPSPFFAKRPTLEMPAPLNITLDVTYDKSGVFAREPQAESVARRALDDWAYFFRSMDVDPVAMGDERTSIGDFTGTMNWRKDYQEDRKVTNQYPFKDLLIYLVGTLKPSERGGMTEMNPRSVQRKSSQFYALPRSANILLSFASPGIRIDSDDDRWWDAGHRRNNLGRRDFYSLVLHETGHALGIHSANSLSKSWMERKQLDGLELEYYLGHAPRMNEEYHLIKGKIANPISGTNSDDPEVDPVSGKPAFGGVRGRMLHSRWQITKLDLLLFKRMGYPMKTDSDPLQPLTMQSQPPKDCAVGEECAWALKARGGVAIYEWRVAQGILPPGLALDSFSGVIAGIPTASGVYLFTVRVKDSNWIHQEEDTRAFLVAVKSSVPQGLIPHLPGG